MHPTILFTALRKGGRAVFRDIPASRTFTPNRVLSTKVDSFLSGSSAVYVDQMYDSWRKNPER